MELSSAHFAEFLGAVHRHQPFPWQQALVDRLADSDEWPDVLDLPTGSGKTVALDAAVFHLALRFKVAARAALRIALVVDRRLVVDDAFARAEKIAAALLRASGRDPDGSGVIGEVARRLQVLAGRGNPPLVAQRLRGGAPLEHDWARTPTQPTILCSTVDQVGSRLLFRGYGVSDRMKPIHAGLLGTHSLVLLDEAHLSEPFRQTLEAVRKIGKATMVVALMSATPGAKAKRPFELSPKDREHPELKKRLEASKLATLGAPVAGPDEAVTRAFAGEARQMMVRLRERGVSPPAVGVVVNRVALARGVFEALLGDGEADAVLMTGRSRGVDRAEVVAKLKPFRTGADARAKANPLFVVATQCLEVGVDLDLDGLVTQAASLDSLRQRFGRLNRAGTSVATEGVVLTRREDVAKKADDPVYGDRIRLTWEALNSIADDRVVDFGVEVLPNRLREAGIDAESLAAERPDAPVVMPAYLDLWSQTSPPPAADPEVALFLHGAERVAVGVSIVWRSDISEDDLASGSGTSLKEAIRLVPPRAAEAVEVPLGAARAWLRRAGEPPVDVADVPAREAKDGGATVDPVGGRPVFRWAGHDGPRTGVVRSNDLRPGDLVIVPSEYGGCDKFGWAPGCVDPAGDVADEAAAPYLGRRCAVRIARDVAQTEAQWERLSSVLEDESLVAPALVDRLLEALSSVRAAEADEGSSDNPPLRDAMGPLDALRRAKGRVVVHRPYGRSGRRGVILVAERGIEDGVRVSVAAPATEDETTSHSSKGPVYLDDHARRVACLAESFARALDLEETNDLGLAALLHDGGKADPRFQVMLSGGDPWNRPDDRPLAKSGRVWSPTTRANAALPRGWRHEALSVRMARAHPCMAGARDRALVLWLIGTHHGCGRPFFDFLDPQPETPEPCLDVSDWRLPVELPGPQSLAFDLAGSDWPRLFEDLKRRYGIWGLAHLEAILRLADHRASEEESES